MANISIKSQKITPFGGIFHLMEKFDRYIGQVIDDELGLRCATFGYQFIETEKYDAKMTYKKFTGYSPGVAIIYLLITWLTGAKILRESLDYLRKKK